MDDAAAADREVLRILVAELKELGDVRCRVGELVDGAVEEVIATAATEKRRRVVGRPRPRWGSACAPVLRHALVLLVVVLAVLGAARWGLVL